MKISEVLQEQISGKVSNVTSNEVVVKDRESGIETRIPKRPDQPGRIQRNQDGELELDAEHEGDVADDIEPGEEVRSLSPDAARKRNRGQSMASQSSQGTV